MSRDKIEEMARDIDKSHWKIEQDFTGCRINSSEMAEVLYNAGYRKASDGAREIFEEIDDKLLECISEAMKGIDRGVRANCVDEIKANLDAKIVLEALRGYIAELKKKYESEGEG